MREMNEDLVSAESRGRLREVSRALVRLHKALLDDERTQFERVRGPVESSGEFLQLVLNDEWFAYLRPLSALVVQIDELLDSDEPTQSEAEALMKQARAMTRPSETDVEFERRYRAALQRDPGVILAHRDATRILSS